MRYLLILCVLFLSRPLSGQVVRDLDSIPVNSDCAQQDVFDLFQKKKPKAPQIPIRKVRAIVLPLIGSSPSTGLQLGVGSSLSWTIGKDPSTKLSAGSMQVLWTTEKQLISYIRTNTYFSRNKYFLQTDWRLYLFRLPTYGLGTGPQENIPELPSTEIVVTGDNAYAGGKFQMKYDWVKFHNILYTGIFPHTYFGIGYHLDYYYNIVDVNLVLDSASMIISPHYAYCILHGFDTREYLTSGISCNLAFDTRDNLINAYKGIYANLSLRFNSKVLGSHQLGAQLWTEFRAYQGLSKTSPRHLLAFWFYGSYKLGGEIPYLNLMSNGFDQMNSSGRGYSQGRWRGEDLIYGELEYRFPISPCTGILGGVIFANVISASNHDMHVPLFGFWKPGAGVGLRIMVGKYDRTNLLIDFGFGEYSKGLYLQATEIF
jgi:hypothetical protein